MRVKREAVLSFVGSSEGLPRPNASMGENTRGSVPRWTWSRRSWMRCTETWPSFRRGPPGRSGDFSTETPRGKSLGSRTRRWGAW